MNEDVLTCYDLQELALWDCINCCPGCHEEKAEGYNVMLPSKLAKDGRKVEACCSVARSGLLVDVEW
jgi:hypothetical protein